MGVLRALSYFFSKFITGYVPTQADWADVFSSFAHKTADKHKMGGGLKEHEVDRPYGQGEAALVNGKIKISRIVQTGAYNEDDWNDYNNSVNDLGIDPWTLGEEVAEGVQRTHRLSIYESLGPIEGSDADIEPGVTEGWADFWVLVVSTEGVRIPKLVSGFVKQGLTYLYDEGSADLDGGYECNYSAPGFDGGYKLSIGDFTTDLAAGKWLLRWKKNHPVFITNIKDIISLVQPNPPELPEWNVLYEDSAFPFPGRYNLAGIVHFLNSSSAIEGPYLLRVKVEILNSSDTVLFTAPKSEANAITNPLGTYKVQLIVPFFFFELDAETFADCRIKISVDPAMAGGSNEETEVSYQFVLQNA